MAYRLTSRLASRILRTTTTTTQIFTTTNPPALLSHHHPIPLRLLSTLRRPTKPSTSIAAKARHLQTRRLWTYALTFSSIAGFIVIVLNQFQDSLVFYVTPTDALAKHTANPSLTKFRLGGLVLENSLANPPNSAEMEFVITDLITDILVRYQGSLPDLFREGHSVVVEGFIKPITDQIKNEVSTRSVSGKARNIECYFSATEVLAKHDEKYMPQEVAAAIEKNKKLIAQELTDKEGKEDIEGKVATA